MPKRPDAKTPSTDGIFSQTPVIVRSLPEVRKTPQMLEIEQAHGGQDIRLILKRLYEKTGSQLKVAELLGLDQATISIWAVRLGIEFTSEPVVKINGNPVAA